MPRFVTSKSAPLCSATLQGGYLEDEEAAFPPGVGTGDRTPRSHNTHLHLIEALTELSAALGALSGGAGNKVRERSGASRGRCAAPHLPALCSTAALARLRAAQDGTPDAWQAPWRQAGRASMRV